MKTSKIVLTVVSLGFGASLLAGCSNNDKYSYLDHVTPIVSAVSTDTSTSSDNSTDSSVFDTSEQDNSDTTNTDTTNTNSSQPPVTVNGINISIGESMQDVESALGQPYDDNKTIVAGDTQDQLVYTNMLHVQEYYIYCDNGIVTGIQDMK